MKKFVMMAALVGMIAAPALAGLAPEPVSSGTVTPYSLSAGPRSPVYMPNDPDHVYDNYPTSLSGPDAILYQLTQNPASGGICNFLTLRPGASLISTAHIVIDGRLATGAWTMSMAFRNNVGGSLPIGAFLNTTGTGAFSAYYIFAGMPFGGVFNMQLTFPSAVVTQTDIWLCLQGSAGFRVRGGENGQGFPGSQFHNNPGDLPSSLYIGSGSGIMASSFGVGMASASLYSAFVIDSAFTTGTRLGNWHVALGGVPEPTTAALIGLLGLVALRRRKA
jgi:hypothetical protein